MSPNLAASLNSFAVDYEDVAIVCEAYEHVGLRCDGITPLHNCLPCYTFQNIVKQQVRESITLLRTVQRHKRVRNLVRYPDAPYETIKSGLESA